MKTVCLYFQVHQPWRLKKYRFFNMGKDHNYLDDLLNRSIMQKVARPLFVLDHGHRRRAVPRLRA